MKSIADIDKNMALGEADNSRLVWRSVKDEAFGLYGSDALSEEGFFRLNEEERARYQPINDGAVWLSGCPSGEQVRFETDSKQIFVRVKLVGKFDMTNMTQIGQCGTDLYVYDEEMKEFVLHEVARYTFDGDEYEVSLSHFGDKPRKMRKYILFLPLYRAVSSYEVGLDEGATVKPFGFKKKGRISVYGTSITQGCGATRPGLAYTNILSRRLDVEVDNYGFSGAAMTEPMMGEILGAHKTDLLIVDTEANAGIDERLEQNAEGFLDAFLKAQPKTPVILYSRVLFAMDRFDEYRINLRAYYSDYLKKLAQKYRRRGYKVHFADGSKIFKGNYTEFTLDGIHPTDVGMFAIADDYERRIDFVRKKYGLKI